MKKVLSLFALLFVLGIQTTTAQECPNSTETKGNLTVRRIYYPMDDICSVGLSSFVPKEPYREYSFDSHGSMLIFLNYGIFNDELRYGTREFYFFPKVNKYPDIEWHEDKGVVEIILTNGERATFDINTTELVDITGADVEVNPDLHPRAKGGVLVKPTKGLVMDTGYMLDYLRTQNPLNKSTFSDSAGRTCDVANGLLFKYPKNGDVIFKHDREGLAALLIKKCPELSL